jgi:hypothetical protein
MKRILILIIPLFLCFNILLSQEIFFGIGFNKTSIRNNNFERIFERFNQTNQWPETFRMYDDIDGLVIDLSIRKEKSMVSLGYNGRRKVLNAEGYDSTLVYHQIELKNTYNYMYVNYFWHLVDHDRFKMGPGIGLGIGSYDILKRNSTIDEKGEYYKVIKEYQLLFSVLYNFSIYIGDHISLNVQPYFQCPIMTNSEVNFAYLEADLNPSYEITHDAWDSYNEWPITWGVAINLSFGGE